MSVQVMSAVAERRWGSVHRKAVMMVLANHADAEWTTFAGQERIAAEAEVGERTVRRVLSDLTGEGLLSRQHRYRRDGTRTSDRVVIHQDAVAQLPAALASSEGDESRDYRPPTTRLPAAHDATTGHSLAAQEPSVEPSVEPHCAPSGARRRPKRARAPDPLFDELVAATGQDPTRLTRTERGRINRALKDLRAVDATPDEIRRGAGEHRRRWPNVTCTASSLAAHWTELVTRPRARSPGEACPGGVCDGGGFLVEGRSGRQQRCPACQAALEEAFGG